MRLMSDLVRRPILRQELTHSERHASWMELFSDLVFVAAIGQVTIGLKAEFKWSGVLTAMLLLLPLWWAWVGQVFYLSRFDTDDLIHRLFNFAVIAAVANLALQIPKAWQGDFSGFVLAYVGVRVILLLQYALVHRLLPEARPLLSRYLIGFGTAALLWTVSAFVPPFPATILRVMAMSIDLLTPFSGTALARKLPFDPSHVPERFGLLTIVVLGEAVLVTIAGLAADRPPIANFTGLIGLFVAFGFWWIYFYGVSASAPRPIRNKCESQRFWVWFYIHFPLVVALDILSVGVAKAIDAAFLPFPKDYGPIFITCAVILMLCLHIIFYMTLPFGQLRRLWRHNVPHIVVSLSVLGLLALAKVWPAWWLVTTVGLLCTAHIILASRMDPETLEAQDIGQPVEDAVSA